MKSKAKRIKFASQDEVAAMLKTALFPNGVSPALNLGLGAARGIVAQWGRVKLQAEALKINPELGKDGDFAEGYAELKTKTADAVANALLHGEESIFANIASEMRLAKKCSDRKREPIDLKDVLLLKAACEFGRVNVYSVAKELLAREVAADARPVDKLSLYERGKREKKFASIIADLRRRMKRLRLRAGKAV